MSKSPNGLMWHWEAPLLHDRLRDAGVVDPETGEPFTVERCDWAIQDAMETACAMEGWGRMPSINPVVWWLIADGVAWHLGIDYSEMVHIEGTAL